jgi:hypothetical protein
VSKHPVKFGGAEAGDQGMETVCFRGEFVRVVKALIFIKIFKNIMIGSKVKVKI